MMAQRPFAGNDPTEYIRESILGSDVDSDTVDLDPPCRGFHVNVAGTIKYNDLAGNTVTKKVNAGSYYPYGVSRLWTTGHTTLGAGDIYLER
jgi:hypothetical protein